MSRVAVAAFVLLALAGCGDDAATEGTTPPQPAATQAAPAESVPPAVTAPAATATEAAPAGGDVAAARRPPGSDGLRVPAERARIVARDSPYGSVLFDANGQVVYVFEPDGPNVSRCTSEECVTAWPPVLTRGDPTAGDGVDAARLGTIRRDDGSLQVTYAGRPLYFYEHEEPGEIRCHDVDIHGGFWWVVTPAGEPAD